MEENNISYSILEKSDNDLIADLGKALSSTQRIKILKALTQRPMNLLELSDCLKMPISSVSFNIDILAKAKLVLIEYKPAVKGHMKLCSLAKTSINISLEGNSENKEHAQISEMPVGCYSNASFEKGYLAGESDFIFREQDCPDSIYSENRFKGELLSFTDGYVEYDFPNFLKGKNLNKYILSFSFELCSEAPYYRNNWPSDITIWVNGVEIATYRSPGDFGGKRGLFTPSYWRTNSTQFGILKNFSIDKNGTYIDGIKVYSHTNISQLNPDNQKSIKLRIGFKDESTYHGGINIFGKHFGNHAQDIVMTLAKNNDYDI